MSDDQCVCYPDTKETILKNNEIKKKQPKIDVLKTSIFDSKTIKKQLKPDETTLLESRETKLISEGPKAIADKCPSGSHPFKFDINSDLEVDSVLVHYKKKAPKQIKLCDAFKLAGFNPTWTKKTINQMLKTPDGQILLNKVNNELMRITGFDLITEELITQCYPNYLN